MPARLILACSAKSRDNGRVFTLISQAMQQVQTMACIPDQLGMERVRVLVVGDAMCDEYWSTNVSRISPEAPIPVAKVVGRKRVLGGAANTAANAAALGAHTTLISALGTDALADEVCHLLERAGVHQACVKIPHYQTTHKLRILGGNNHQQLLRLDAEVCLPPSAQAALDAAVRDAISVHDILIFSDYAKGCLEQIEAWLAYARQLGKITLVDPKGTSWERYRLATAITPNAAELQAVTGPFFTASLAAGSRDLAEAALAEKIERLLGQYHWQYVVLTRGEHGMTLVGRDLRKHFVAQAREVFDVSGAGDTVVAALAVLLGAGLSWEQAAHWANVAAGIAVGKRGTATVSWAELFQASHVDPGPSADKVYTETQALEQVSRWEKNGQKVVMTNGCFDILHPGHVSYLEAARALGDRLLVAVNTDDSVRCLKGASRPVQTLDVRSRMLAALQCVDGVVAFSESTPERLIARVSPHILVKGGDYTVEQVAGAEHVIQHGGTVKILPLLPGYSTTATLSRIHQSAQIPAAESTVV